jgi:hypothetical protein
MATMPRAASYSPRLRALAAALSVLAVVPAQAIDTKVSGRVSFGASYRLQAQDPELLYSFNAAAVGKTGLAGGGQNSDDANMNFNKHDATTRVLKAYVDFAATEGKSTALLRLKAWHDFALGDNPRAWGNTPSGYAAGQPLSDAGAPRQSRFSGVALSDAYLQHSGELAGMKAMGRLGQQSLDWGQRAGFPGGLQGLNPVDLPATRRPGAVPQELRVPVPMLFARIEPLAGIGVEGFYQTRFRPNALDVCGTFNSPVDYLADGCDKAFAGAPATSDRQRLQNGAYLKRVDSPHPTDDAQFGAALTWKDVLPALDAGLYYARYTNRTPTPGMRKSTRVGSALIPLDPDGKNLAFFLEYVRRIELYAFTLSHKRGATTIYGELSYRPNQPLQLPPGDVLGAFISPTAPALLRANATATAPGGYFGGYDRYHVTQSQIGVAHDLKWGSTPVNLSAEVVSKHVASLPDPLVRRYLRADQFGQGPTLGACVVNTPNAARQCSTDGYVSSDAYAYRLRADARFPAIMPALDAQATALFIHEVKGWSYDGLLNEGRRSMNLALRVEYRQRYVAEVVLTPIWGGAYNHVADRDQIAFSAGVKF